MVVIPGLSGPLEGVGKYVRTWDDSGSRLVVDVVGGARSANRASEGLAVKGHAQG